MLEQLVVPVEWKAEEDGGVLVGYASTFGNVDLGGDVVVKGAFAKSVQRIKKEGIPLLADHVPATTHVLGTIFDAKEDNNGLVIRARLSSAPSAQDIRTKLVEGHLNRLSIGYETLDDSIEEQSDGRRVRLLKEVKLWETSVVVFPMNPEAVISRVKSVAAELVPADRKRLLEQLADVDDDAPTDSPAGAPGHAPGDEPGAEDGRKAATADDESVPLPDEGTPWDHWSSEAVLAGRDPEATVSNVERAGMTTRLELLERSLAELTAPADPDVRKGLEAQLRATEDDMRRRRDVVAGARRSELTDALSRLEGDTLGHRSH